MRRVLENWASCMNESLGSLRARPSKYICLGQKKATESCTALHQHVCDHVLPLPSPGELSAQRSGQLPPLHLLMVREPSARYCCPPATKNLQSPLSALGYLSRCIFFFPYISVTVFSAGFCLLNIPQCTSKGMFIFPTFWKKGLASPLYHPERLNLLCYS